MSNVNKPEPGSGSTRSGAGRQSSAAHDDDEIDLLELFSTVRAGKWRIALCVLLAVLAAKAYLYIAIPIYQTDVVLQVEDKSGGSVLGELPSLLGEQPGAQTEIEVLKSRSIIGKVVDRQQLDITARPRYFPVVGEAIARRYSGIEPAPAPFASLEKYSWGGEVVSIGRLDVTQKFLGAQLIVEARDKGSFDLKATSGELLGSGQVGRRLVINGSDGEPSLSLFVSELKAREGTEFLIRRARRVQAVAGLRSGLAISEKGRQTGVIEAVLAGPDPAAIQLVLQDVANEYVKQNVERLSAEAEKSLEFLKDQLPQVRSQLEASESELTSYRKESNAADLTFETRSLLDKLVNIESELRALQLRRDALLQRYAEQHPSVLALEEQKQSLERSRDELKYEIEDLPQTQQDVLRLSRDAKVDSELYTFLLNKSQELRVVKAGTVGNVRILDSALEPYAPIKPKKSLVLLLGVLLGLLVGVVWVLARQALRNSVVSPQQAEEAVGLPVFAVVPHSDVETNSKPKRLRGKKHMSVPLLGVAKPSDPAFEAIRSLRTSLHFALMGSENKHVVITGPSPGIGKSFLSTNLGLALAQAGNKVLVIDADMRKGHINRYFDCPRGPGLSELLSDKVTFEKVLVELDEEPLLHLVPTGEFPPNPSELLLTPRWAQLLEDVDKLYDVIVIDTPPVLAVTDACIAAQNASAVFVVTRYAVNTADELKATIDRLENNNVNVSGLVFNGLERSKQSGRYDRYSYYHYEYK